MSASRGNGSGLPAGPASPGLARGRMVGAGRGTLMTAGRLVTVVS